MVPVAQPIQPPSSDILSDLSPPYRVQLGTGTIRMNGWVNCDYKHTPFTDLAFDCQDHWPLPDNSVAHVYASHMLEHLPRPLDFFREMHRCLMPNATVCLRVPFGAHRSAWLDLTHIRPWFAESLCCLQPGYAESVGNPQHTDWTAYYGIHATQLRIDQRLRLLVRYPWMRRFTLPLIGRIVDSVEEIWMHLFALKGEWAVEEYRKNREPNSCPAQYAMYDHHFYGVPYNEEHGLHLVTFGDEGIAICDYGKRKGRI